MSYCFINGLIGKRPRSASRGWICTGAPQPLSFLEVRLAVLTASLDGGQLPNLSTTHQERTLGGRRTSQRPCRRPLPYGTGAATLLTPTVLASAWATLSYGHANFMDPLQIALLQTSPWLTSLSDCGDNQWSCSALFAHIQLGTFLPGSSPLLCPPLFGFGTNAGGRGNNIQRSHCFCSHHSSPGQGGFPCTSEEGQGFKYSSWTMKRGVLTGLPGRQGNTCPKLQTTFLSLMIYQNYYFFLSPFIQDLCLFSQLRIKQLVTVVGMMSFSGIKKSLWIKR